MPQKKRVVVTLDPDYIPWEHNEDVVKLRHKKIPKWLFAVIALIGVVVMAVVNQAKINRQIVQQQSAAVIATPVSPTSSTPAGWCDYAGVLLPPGVHTIGDRQRECKNGKLVP